MLLEPHHFVVSEGAVRCSILVICSLLVIMTNVIILINIVSSHAPHDLSKADILITLISQLFLFVKMSIINISNGTSTKGH